MPDQNSLDLLNEATQRLVRSVDALADEAWGEPSLLPAWTRAHVLAHLTLNAEGLAGALQGIVQGEPVPMYASSERRDADIDNLAGAGASELRTRFLGATTDLADAVTAVPDDAWATVVERVPGGPTFHAGAVPGMRLREVEIHHVDLGTGATQAEWSPEFVVQVLDAMVKRGGAEQPFVARATDLGRDWSFGGGPTVSGTGADLAWWLTGRGQGAGLTSDGGELPVIGAW
jgi:maleylpyruvate isomerase